jgi:hypothetical protein
VRAKNGVVAAPRARPLKILYHHRVRSRDGQAVHIEEMIAALRETGAEVIVVEPPGFSSSGFGGESRGLSFMRRHVPRAFYELLELSYSALASRAPAPSIP